MTGQMRKHSYKGLSSLRKFLIVIVSLVIINIVLVRFALDSFQQPRNTTLEERRQPILEGSVLSNLGKYLYLEQKPTINNDSKEYTILIWQHGKRLENRHYRRFTDSWYDPFEDCSVKNCKITYKETDLEKAHAVVFHLHLTRSPSELPLSKRSKLWRQRWVFLTDESPFHTFMGGRIRLSEFDGLFNWSMTYRPDSDVPVPYGRSVRLLKNFRGRPVPENKRNDKLVAIMVSNCHTKNNRLGYVRALQEHLDVDVYGNCGKLKCAGHFNKDCPSLNDYKFYLAFENANCNGYATEKLWSNALAKDAIPIIMGISSEEAVSLLPPNSYLNVDDFASPASLASYIMFLNSSFPDYETFFQWKLRYTIRNEHGYFGAPSYHYCRLCEALNYNDPKPKVYDDLEEFWSVRDCYPSWNEQ